MDKEFENYLVESLKIDKTILKAITSSGFKINKKDFEGDIQLGDTEKTLSLDGQQRKAGGVIKTLIPDLSDPDLNIILGKIKANRATKKKEFEIVLSDKVSSGYAKAMKEGNVRSCMVGKPSLTKFYDNHPNVQIALLKIKGKTMARAIVWHHCIDADGDEQTFMDRIYPDNDKFKTIYHDFAKKNKWIYRAYNKISRNGISHGKQIFVDVDFDNPITFPYMDTLTRAYPSEGFITNQEAADAAGRGQGLRGIGGTRVDPPKWNAKRIAKSLKKYEHTRSDGKIEIRKNVDLTKFELSSIPEYFKDKIIVGNFVIAKNYIKSLKNSPIEVQGNYDVYMNKGLKSLTGCTQTVSGHFRAYGCDLKSLKGAPNEVGRSFNVSRNANLKSLEGGPEHVGYRYWAHHCALTSLKGIASSVKKDDQCRFDDNPGNFTPDDVRNAITRRFDKQKDVDFYSDEGFGDDLDESSIIDIYSNILNG